MMDFLLPLASVLGGVLLLVRGGDRLVLHSAHLAATHRVPKAVVGAVVMGFGTSLPELLVSMDAALLGRPGIALGNLVGSNIANVGLILGVGALVATLHVQRSVIRVDLPLGVLAALFLGLWVGPRLLVSRGTGLGLLAAFAAYLGLALRHTRRHRAVTTPEDAANPSTRRDLLWILGGLVAIGVGAHLLVHGAVGIARLLEVGETVIGLTLVALGTSVPELAATVAAARHGEADLAVGNITGSNLFNILFVLGLTAVVTPIPVAEVMPGRDFPVLAIFSVLLFPLFTDARRISRIQGLILLLGYAGYVLWVWRTRV